MAAAVAAARRQRHLGGDSECHHTIGGLSFDFASRTQSELDAIKEKESDLKWINAHQTFPRKADIIKDLELGVLCNRKAIMFLKKIRHVFDAIYSFQEF